MKAIILCGGKGTRLREVIGEKQKTMAIVKGEPFLLNIVNYLKLYGITEIIFAIGYKADEVKNYFLDGKKFGINPFYALETILLGTGGAMKNALDLYEKTYGEKNESYLVMNGDTIFRININALIENHKNLNTDLTIAVKKNVEKERFGNITLKDMVDDENGFVKSFTEKEVVNDSKEQIYINGGIYIIKSELIRSIENKPQSFEKEIIPMWLKEKKIGAYISEANFIDIGTKESFEMVNN